MSYEPKPSGWCKYKREDAEAAFESSAKAPNISDRPAVTRTLSLPVRTREVKRPNRKKRKASEDPEMAAYQKIQEEQRALKAARLYKKRMLSDNPPKTLLDLPQELLDMIFKMAFKAMPGVKIIRHREYADLKTEKACDWRVTYPELAWSNEWKVEEWMVSKSFFAMATKGYFDANWVRGPHIHSLVASRFSMVRALARHIDKKFEDVANRYALSYDKVKSLRIEMGLRDCLSITIHSPTFSKRTESDFDRLIEDGGLMRLQDLRAVEVVLLKEKPEHVWSDFNNPALEVCKDLEAYLQRRILRIRGPFLPGEESDRLYPGSQVARLPLPQVSVATSHPFVEGNALALHGMKTGRLPTKADLRWRAYEQSKQKKAQELARAKEDVPTAQNGGLVASVTGSFYDLLVLVGMKQQ
ncbi:hypothetical protein MBLNU230_g6069t1 [Neophaeotheca triangularis]